MNTQWKIFTVQPEDLEEIGELTQLIYGMMWKRAGNSKYYNWKFYSGDRGEPNAKVARTETSIVGFQSSCHRLFRFGNQSYWSTELGDSMTHPRYRRQGMWSKITGQIIDDSLERGFDLVFGFPNKVSYQGYIKKLSMTHFLSLWRLALPLGPSVILFKDKPSYFSTTIFELFNAVRTAWIRVKCRQDKSMRVERNCRVADWADELWLQEKKHFEAGVVKNADYLRWRFDTNPDEYNIYKGKDQTGKALGLLVTKVRRKEDGKVFGFIADIMVPSRNRAVFNRLLLEAELDFKRAGVILVDAWTTSNRFYLYGLLSFGFFPVTRLPFIVPIVQARALRRKGWDSSNRWVLTMADSDNI